MEKPRKSGTKKTRRGRPVKAKAEKRATMVKMMTTEDELEALRAAAEAEGLPLSSWLRYIALNAARKSTG